jgi:phospholipid/cholesterol/gamma-HCH transport system ATP-binding protein
MEAIIELDKVTITTDVYTVLTDISLPFQKGKSTVIIGPSGCGKSILLKTAAGLTIPDLGRILVDGRNILRLSARALKRFRRENGFVFQDAALWANLTIFENLALPLRFHFPELSKDQVARRVEALLEKTGLRDEAASRPERLSIGEQKMVSFLRALVTRPSLIFLDEPTLSIDRRVARIIYDMIRELKTAGCTLITVTHDPDLTSWLADYLVVLNQGKIVKYGPFDEVKSSPDPMVQSILTSVLSKAASYDTDILELLNE